MLENSLAFLPNRCWGLFFFLFFSDELLEGPRNNTVYYAIPSTNTDEDKQGKNFTKDEVEEMMKSDAYQRKIATCHL